MSPSDKVCLCFVFTGYLHLKVLKLSFFIGYYTLIFTLKFLNGRKGLIIFAEPELILGVV